MHLPVIGSSISIVRHHLWSAAVWAIASSRQRGVVTTAAIAASVVEDSVFDWRFGTETRRAFYTDQLEVGLANRAHAVRYKATKARPFLELLARLRLPAGSSFVDVGSGKGRVLLLAAQHPFRRVVGIEFSRALCEQARRNIEIFRRRTDALAPIEVCEADATRFAFGGDENVFFLYNPFDGVILEQFVENLRQSLAAHPRRIWLIYNVPQYAAVLDQSGVFAGCESLTIRGNEFRVYTNSIRP